MADPKEQDVVANEEEAGQPPQKGAKKAKQQTAAPSPVLPLDEIQQRASMAYTAYLEAQRQVEDAYKDQEQQTGRAYQQAKEQARKAYGESIAQALRTREEAEERARKVYEESAAQALRNLEEAEQKAWEAHNEAMEQTWLVFTKSRR